MDKVNHIRQVLTRQGAGSAVTERQVVDVLATLPKRPTFGVPHQGDDTRDYHTELLLMTSEQREHLGLPPREPAAVATVTPFTPREIIESLGARDAVPPTLLPGVKLQVRVHAIVCRNDDGRLSDGRPGETRAELAARIASTIAEVNKIYAGSDVELLFFPWSDLEIRNETRLNQDFVVPAADIPKLSQQPPCTEAQIRALAEGPWSTDAYRNDAARGYPGRMVLLFAEGTTYRFGTAPTLQDGWRWCSKCQGLFFLPNAGSRCPAGGLHDGRASGRYTMITGGAEGLATQTDWRWCSKCQGLAFGGAGGGTCPAGGGHDEGGSADYRVLLAHGDVDPNLQTNWRWCSKCQGMTFGGNPAGACPAGGQHDLTRSWNYAMTFERAPLARWELSSPSGGGFSWADKEYVKLSGELGTDAPGYATFLAHETGHYLHLWHPFYQVELSPAENAPGNSDAQKIATLETKIRNLLQGERNAGATPGESVRILDADRSVVSDTPPDDSGALLDLINHQADNTNACGLIGTVNVTFQDGASASYSPDRSLVMSYFKGCLNFNQHFSPDQVARMRAALIEKNRRHLVATQLGDTAYPYLRFGALWNQGTQNQVWWPMCTEHQLRQKIGELWGAMRIKEMHAFVLGSQVWYSALWEPGQYAQIWWPNCSEAELRAKTAEVWGGMRIAQMQAFVVGGQVRYACLWNQGTHSQIWWPNCSEVELRAKTDELWATKRIAQMQAFMLGGEVRFSCLWNQGTFPQVWWPNCSDAEFREKTGELWGSMRPGQLQPFVAWGQIRFSALWNQGTHAQVWWPCCTEEQLRLATGDMWDTMRPASWHPVVVG